MRAEWLGIRQRVLSTNAVLTRNIGEMGDMIDRRHRILTRKVKTKEDIVPELPWPASSSSSSVAIAYPVKIEAVEPESKQPRIER